MAQSDREAVLTTSNEDLKRDVQDVFGVVLSDEDVEAARGRLPNMLANARLLDRWASRLGNVGPAQIQRVVAKPD